MKKILILATLFVYLLFPGVSFAKDPNFDITVNSTYQIQKNGMTKLIQDISIKNKTEYYYTPTYSISLGFENIQNIKAYGPDGSIPFTIDEADEDNKVIKLKFEERYAGLNQTNDFVLELETNNIAENRGNIWDVSIPGISEPDDFFEYNIIVEAPDSFGLPMIIKPTKESNNLKSLVFEREEIGRAGVYLIFGESQYYNFDLTYNISNPNLFPVKTEIALPPNTNYQNVLINSYSKKPDTVRIDEDGNWIAEYSLFPQQKETIVVDGIVEILPNPKKSVLSEKDVQKYLSTQKYWEVSDNRVKQAAKDIKSAHDVYDFVTQTLSYNFDKVTGDNERLGAKGALANPINSVCLEFTDLFVAMARSAGIPARAVEGYAYTSNSSLRPLSLVEDVLHSWPEYYDRDRKAWIMVDPTWGNTTKGMDYFSSLDFEHIAFVIKGSDSEYPIPAGGYKFDQKSKDVAISFIRKEDFKINEKIEITDSFPDFLLPNFPIEGDFIIKNTGNNLIIDKTAIVVTDRGERKEYKINNLPPGGEKRISLKFNNSNFLTNNTKTLTIQIDNFTHTKKVKVSFIPEGKSLLIFGGIIGGSIAIAIITYYSGSLFIQRRKRSGALRGKSKGH